MLKYWSNAFMTTGAAIVATGVFTDKPLYGVVSGVVGILIGALFNWKNIKEKGV